MTYKTPVPIGEVYFSETFDDGSLDRWQVSKTMKEDADDEIAKYDGKKQTTFAPHSTLSTCVCFMGTHMCLFASVSVRDDPVSSTT